MTREQIASLAIEYKKQLIEMGAEPIRFDEFSKLYCQYRRDVSLNHLCFMCKQVADWAADEKFTNIEKIHRWLGFIQGTFFILNLFSIDKMRVQNSSPKP